MRKISSLIIILVMCASIIGGIGPIGTAQALTGGTVTVAPYKAATAANYTVAFTTATNLVTGDTISIVFPTGTTVGSVLTTDISGVTPSAVAVQGQRVNITLGANEGAGAKSVVIGNTKITNPATAGSYTLQVYTSKETTAVSSSSYTIYPRSSNQLAAVTVTPTTNTVGVASIYTVAFTTGADGALAATNTITIVFPTGTTVPNPIAPANVTVTGTTGSAAASNVAVSGYQVTVTIPTGVSVTAGGAGSVVFATGAGILNPTTAGTTYTANASTSVEAVAQTSGNYSIVAGDISKLVFTTFPTTIAPSTAASITVQTQDQYGNPKAVGAETAIVLTSNNGGAFSGNPVNIANGNNSIGFTYTNTNPGASVTIGADEAVSQGWIAASGTLTVAAQVQLWHGATQVGSYNTITAALAAAITGDTIKVPAGTYNQEGSALTISKSVTIESIAGAPTTIIDLGNGGIAIATNGVTLGGTGKGFTIKGGNANAGVIVTNADATSNIIIQGNTIRSLHSGEGNGIYVNKAKGMTIDGNYFYGDAPWTADGVGCGANGIQVFDTEAASPSLTVSNNIAYYLKYTFLTIQCTGKNIDNVVVTGNTVHDVRYHGVHVIAGAVSSNKLKISQNKFYNNGTGIQIESGVTGVDNIVINYNDIYNNTNTAGGKANKDINNLVDTNVDAKYNWWGNASGPLDTTNNPGGKGNAVSTYVTYSPWLYTSYAAVVPTSSPAYATSVVLDTGWRTFSAPIWLDSSGDTWGELRNLSNFVTSYSLAYRWDSSSQSWALLTDSYTMNPLEGVFVKMTAKSSLPILYSTDLMPAATRSLPAGGWSLIGINNLANDTVTNMLPSIAGNYSQLIDPISGNVLAGNSIMNVGAGYWVFMINTKTLAGFVGTPQAFVALP